MGKVFAVVVAAGRSTRMGGVNKQLLPLSGVPVLVRSLAALEQSPGLEGIVLVASEESTGRFRALANHWGLKKLKAIVSGGDNRQQSVYSGLLAVPSECSLVLVHDGARPLVSKKEIEDIIAAAAGCGAATLAVPVKDTVKEAGPGGFVARTPDRSRLWLTLTPQCFSFEILMEAHRQALESGLLYTDDASLVEAAGKPVRLVEGSYRNIKITTPEDLAVAEALLKSGNESTANSQFPIPNSGDRREIPMRVGFGYDVHRLVPERKLILGGVEIPYEKGLEGHSDADVLVHAIMDALLGAAGMGDIGRHFPDTDPAYRGISSIRLLGEVRDKLAARGYRPHNVDATIVAQAPRLAGHIGHMRGIVAGALGIEESLVNIKATTTEGLGFTGTGEGIASYAVALLLEVGD